MILSRSTPRCLSRSSLLLLGLFGLGLLPLAPTVARSGPAQSTPVAKPSDTPILAQNSCVACHQSNQHQPPQPPKKKSDSMHLHDEVVKLLNERADLQKRLRQTEDRLKDALKRFEKKQQPPATDDRLEKLEKNLKRLLDEVESLRRELKPAKKAPGKPAAGDLLFINKRSFRLPVHWDDRKLVKEVRLWSSSDEGRNWALEAFLRYPQDSVSFKAPKDGTYWFCLWPVYANSDPEELPRFQPTVRVVVDTTEPVIRLTLDRSGKDGPVLRWELEDQTLDLSTLKAEFRQKGRLDWAPLDVEPTAKGSLALPRGKAGDLLLSVADKAGNKSLSQLKVE